jgi:hypothetical protein
MTLASWKSVEAEHARLAARPLRLTAQRANLDQFIWPPPIWKPTSASSSSTRRLAALQTVGCRAGLEDKIRRCSLARSSTFPNIARRCTGRCVAMARASRPPKPWPRSREGRCLCAQGCFRRPRLSGEDHPPHRHRRIGPRPAPDLGRAAQLFIGGPHIRFVANVDPEDFAEQTAGLDAKTTLVLVVSKSFKTPETASNAALGREWLVKQLGEAEANNHLAAVSSAPDKAKAWGAAEDRIFPMDESVGGRYSVWSSVGLSLQIALGADVWSPLPQGRGRDGRSTSATRRSRTTFPRASP